MLSSAEEYKQRAGIRAPSSPVPGQKIGSRADFLAYAKPSLLPSEILRRFH